MSDAQDGASSRAAALRFAFDRGFAEPRTRDDEAAEDFLAIRLEAEPYAIRLSEIGGLSADKKITRLPGRTPALLGITGFRRAIVPVYDLRALLGYPAADGPRWLVTAAAKPVAFAFDAFEGHFRASRDAIAPLEAGTPGRRHVQEFVHAQALIRPVVQLASALAAIGNLGGRGRPSEERRL